jgi:hypothetical protein
VEDDLDASLRARPAAGGGDVNEVAPGLERPSDPFFRGELHGSLVLHAAC